MDSHVIYQLCDIRTSIDTSALFQGGVMGSLTCAGEGGQSSSPRAAPPQRLVFESVTMPRRLHTPSSRRNFSSQVAYQFTRNKEFVRRILSKWELKPMFGKLQLSSAPWDEGPHGTRHPVSAQGLRLCGSESWVWSKCAGLPLARRWTRQVPGPPAGRLGPVLLQFLVL